MSKLDIDGMIEQALGLHESALSSHKVWAKKKLFYKKHISNKCNMPSPFVNKSFFAKITANMFHRRKTRPIKLSRRPRQQRLRTYIHKIARRS